MKNIIVILLLGTAVASVRIPHQTLQEYFNAVRSGDWQTAESLWDNNELAHSRRLGIKYLNCPLKIDSASPLYNAQEQIRQGKYDMTISAVNMTGQMAEAEIFLGKNGHGIEYTYYLQEAGGEWRLISPLTYHATGWKVRITQYVNLYYTDDCKLNDYAVAELDRFIAELGNELGIPEARMKLLESAKLDYYLGTEEQVEKLTGHRCQGMTNLQFDAVISQQLPHYHELTHFMVNFAMQELPLYTMPFMQEGTAVYFGGRWGKSPNVVLQLGEYVLREKMHQAGEVLTWEGFETIGNADFSYPLAGLWVSCLRRSMQPERFLQLYRRLSGTAEKVRGIDIMAVRAIIAKETGRQWGEIAADFKKIAAAHKYSGIRPGYGAKNSTLKAGEVQITQESGEYWVDARVKGDKRKTVFFKDNDNPVAEGYRSWMFAEQHPGREYRGEAMGLLISAREAGLYDYRTNVLVAKYVTAFQGEEGYMRDGVVSVKVEGELVGEGMEVLNTEY